ncbi:LysE family translocator [Pseudomonas fulva]|nr:LysE family translocator [Pseudomonas fulva]MBF8780296.1 LysE family translocator [Pseudomonas fulva]
MPQSLLPFSLFALVASLSPGPTNLLILAIGAQHGLRATVALVFTACVSAALVVLLVGLGLGELLASLAWLQQALAWLGVAWLSRLAWQMWRAADRALEPSGKQGITAWGVAMLQLVNPKVWLMATAVISVFAGPAGQTLGGLLLLSTVFLLIALPCMGAWAVLGASSTRLLQAPAGFRRFNRLLAALLLISAWSTLLL